MITVTLEKCYLRQATKSFWESGTIISATPQQGSVFTPFLACDPPVPPIGQKRKGSFSGGRFRKGVRVPIGVPGGGLGSGVRGGGGRFSCGK